MKGVLIYAFNNQRIDYFAQAEWCANRVNHFLKLPVSIVTDASSQNGRSSRHNIIYSTPESGGQRVYNPNLDHTADIWINANRYQSWDLSPYDETVVLDSDYIVCSDQLSKLFYSPISVTAIKNVYDVTGRDNYAAYQWISNRRGLHHYWATVLFFRRDQVSQDFFEMMSMTRQHYQHYAKLYKFPSTPFRNDFAASIALTAVYGHLPEAVPEIPWSMANVFSDVEISMINHNTFDLYYVTGPEKKHRRTRISGQDFHFMNKVALAALYAN